MADARRPSPSSRLHVADTPPPVLLGPPSSIDLSRWLRSGWTTIDGFALPAVPWDLTSLRLICVGSVADAEAAGPAVAAVARGAGLAVSLGLTGNDRRRFLEDLERLGATPTTSTAHPRDGLEPHHTELLDLLVTGATLTAAATRLHLSRRTAHRRLAEARQRLGVDTTAEAVAAWLTRR